MLMQRLIKAGRIKLWVSLILTALGIASLVGTALFSLKLLYAPLIICIITATAAIYAVPLLVISRRDGRLYMKIIENTEEGKASLDELSGAVAVNDKKVAGMYYFPTSNAYKSESQTDKPLAVGRTLNDMELIIKQDGEITQTQKSKVIPVSIDKNGLMKGASSKDDIDAFIKYATLVSENAVSQMADGVIVASPYENSCGSCPFIALCGREEENGRTVGSVNEDKIIQAVKEVD